MIQEGDDLKQAKSKTKVLILYNKLFHYRIPIFSLLSKKYDLSVCYSIGPDIPATHNFSVRKLPINKIKRFVIHKENIYKLCQEYDAVIAYGDIAWLSFSYLGFMKKRKFKLLYWTIGVSASYDKKFDQVKKWDKVRTYIYRNADALIFYSDYPVKKYAKEFNFSKDRMFVAHNTVQVFESNNKICKDSLLFIGTLYLEKGVMSLLENYKKAKIREPDIPKLNLIGTGPEEEKIKKWIHDNGLENSVFLLGPIFNVEKKANFFLSAFACISPLQSGLSVLESMGYGVPFITLRDSITGGERLNIDHKKNGILLETVNELEEVILDIFHNKQKYIEMGQNAKSFYQTERTPEIMAGKISEAIEFVLNQPQK